MWKTLAYKELRESLVIVGLALLGFVLVLGGAMRLPALPFSGIGRDPIPFLGGSFLSFYVLIGLALGVTLGLRQTLGEAHRGTWLYLLHRPAERWKLLAWKLVTGGALLMGTTLLPLLIYAVWAATPGNHAGPFDWSTTLPSWQAWLSFPELYLAAVLTGLRPVRWFGSRLLPLAGAGALTFLIQFIPWWWPLGAIALAVLDVWLIAAALYVIYVRDY